MIKIDDHRTGPGRVELVRLRLYAKPKPLNLNPEPRYKTCTTP